MTRLLTYAQAVNEAQEIALRRDPSVFIIGEGVPDPKGIFGTTAGLAAKFPGRVMDMPVAESGMTGICVGAAIAGMRPIMVHARMDFTLYAMDAIVNTAAKWYFMFAQKHSVPLVIRMIIGRGWGQGPQHSQSLQALYAHIPGLKVVMPSTAYDAKGLLLCAVKDPNPVIFIEHRWLHTTTGHVPAGYYTVPIGVANVLRPGRDITVVSDSHMTVESIRTLDALVKIGVDAELIDLRSIVPMDMTTILASVRKTGRLLVVDTGAASFGVAAEIVCRVCERLGTKLKRAPERIGLPYHPAPTSWMSAKTYYPTRLTLAKRIIAMVGWNPLRLKKVMKDLTSSHDHHLDTPDKAFTGPF